MNKIFKYSIGVLFTGLMMTACSPDEFSGADPNGIPTISGADFTMTVDQETNQMVANYTPAAGTYPIWIINGASYSTLNEVGYNNPEAGTYSIELKIGNRNGISQAGIKKEFTFNETKIDYSADFRRITEKEWRFANKEAAHLGCGPIGTDGAAWWAAAADEKKGTGMYDDRITFTADNRKGGTYSYNPGEDGKTYVNTGTTIWGSEGADWDATIGAQSASWYFEPGTYYYYVTDDNGQEVKVEETCTYIVLAPNTVWPYISADKQYQEPRFRIEQLTAKKLVLIYDNTDGNGISWRFIFTSEEGEVEFNGFKADSDFNMWKGITPSATFYFNPGWAGERTGEMEATYKGGNNDYTVTVPAACTDRWQAQFHLHTADVNLSAANHYDFSVILNADKDINGVTIKLTNEADNDFIIDVDNVNLKANEDYIFWLSDIEGKDLQPVKLVFDFGRAAEPTTVNVSSVVLKDHANDDGTVLPSEQEPEEEGEKMDWNYEAGNNLWTAVDQGSAYLETTVWFADGGWNTLPTQPTVSHSGDAWELDTPEGLGSSQWQGQVKIFTTLTAQKSKAYNFYCVVEADGDIPGATIKLCQSDESADVKHDGNFFFADQHNIKADKPYVYKATEVSLNQDDAHALTLVFDFAGAPTGTHIKISKIYFEETVAVSYDDEGNLWKAVDAETGLVGIETWFADGSWNALPNQPNIKHNANKWEFDVPEGTGSTQWQGQVKIHTNIAAKQADAYNFALRILADSDIPGVTIKLTQSDEADAKHDGNFFFAGQHDVKADEVFNYKEVGAKLGTGDAHALTLVLDFAGAPEGTHVVISDITLEKSE